MFNTEWNTLPADALTEAEKTFIEYWGNGDTRIIAVQGLYEYAAFLLQDCFNPNAFAVVAVNGQIDPEAVDELKVEFKEASLIFSDYEKLLAEDYAKSGIKTRLDTKGLEAAIAQAISE